MKVALVYDRVNTPYGGAEKVLLALKQAFPQADLLTSVYHHRAKWANKFTIKPSFLQKIPGANRLHRYFVWLMPLAFESLDVSEYDLIISVTSAEAKGIITQPHQTHICYLLTPTRYLYSHRTHYEQTHWPFKIPLLKLFSRKIFDYLLWWDQVAAQRPDLIIPISNLVKNRAEEFYHRPIAEVIYPPFDPQELTIPKNLQSFKPYYLPDKFNLVISRLVPYKRIELAINACQQLDQDLVIIGEGPALKELKKIAGSHVYFVGNVTLTQRQAILNQAQAVLMPGIEDFGITAIEAAVSGKPIILHQDSGAAELIKNYQGTILLHQHSVSELKQAIKKSLHLKTQSSSIKKKLAKYAINDFTALFKNTAVKFYKQQQQKGRS